MNEAGPGAEEAYAFRHALTRDAAYQLMLPRRRAELHELAAAAATGSPLERGRHLTSTLRLWRAMGSARAARIAAISAKANLFASAWCRDREMTGEARECALAAVEAGTLAPAEQAAALLGLAGLVADTNSPAEAMEHVDRAAELAHAAGNAMQEGSALCLRVHLLHLIGRASEALTLANRAVELLEPLGITRELGEAHLRRGIVLDYLLRPDEAELAFARSIAVLRAPGTGDSRLLRQAELCAARNAARDPARVDDALVTIRSIVQMGPAQTGYRQFVNGYASWGLVLYRAGRLAEARDVLIAARRESRAVGSMGALAEACRMLAQVHRDLGELAPALEAANEAAVLHRQRGNPNGECEAEALTGDILLRSGKAADALGPLRRSLELLALVEHPGIEQVILGWVIRAARESGDDVAAVSAEERLRALPPDDHAGH